MSMKKLFVFIWLFWGCNPKNVTVLNLEDELLIPKKYFAKKATNKIIIDGVADESDWLSAPFSEDFIDIEGTKTPYHKTNFKILWDDEFLYVYAKLEENHVWGDIYERDQVIFHNNDFEVYFRD